MASTELDTRIIEELGLDWEVPCKPVQHVCDRAATWAYERTHSCGCRWEVFYCSPCRDHEMAGVSRSQGASLCCLCHKVMSITCSWRPLHG